MSDAFINIAKKFIPNKIRICIKKILWKIFGLKWKLKSGINIKVASYAEWVIYNDIFVDGEYNLPIEKSLSVASNKPLILLDLGANVGYFTLKAADFILTKNPNADFLITLVEGSPSNYRELESRLTKQPVLANKIRLVRGLIGKLEGKAKICEIDFHAKNAVCNNGKSKGVIVPFVNLNSIFSENQEVDLLKCDIEGFEQIFIENHKKLLKKVKFVVFELHSGKCDIEHCIHLLGEAGFLNHTKLDGGLFAEIHFFWK